MKTKMTVATLTMLFLVGMLAMAYSPVAKAHTEADPFVTDLIAAQTIDAGDVSVWNDGTHLYVRFETADDWVMQSTHLHVATTLEGIPQTKKGSPKPGHFDYMTPHDPPVTEFTYMIELGGWVPETELYIAAHAVVCGPGEDGSIFAQGLLITVPLYTWPDAINAGTVTVAIEGENLVVTYEAASGWELFDTHLYVEFTPPPTYPPQWWNFPYIHWVLDNVHTDTFVIPLASLGVECDDVLYVSTHARLIGHDEFGEPILVDGWGDENPFDGWTKYFSVTIPCDHVCETAWGNGQEFPGKNWAMYFTYTVQ